MIEIKQDNTIKAAIVCPIIKTDSVPVLAEDITNQQNEAKGLVLAMGQTIVLCESFRLSRIIPKTFFGKGNLDKIKTLLEENEAKLLVIDMPISAVQQRNLEKYLDIKVIDRTAVILEIFGGRANTNEGKLQVELAHLTYQRGRLVRSWTHLERQRGGGGFLGGPGETQIELDRRHIDNRIIKIKKELEKVKLTRSIQRNSRSKVPYPIVALVGYTNAGKSTLFNNITKADVFAQDMLFATLDPTLRKIELKKGCEVILSDTVGFISNLPHELVMSFRATLEEVLEADIIVHVIDISNSEYLKQREDVLDVLHQLGLENIETKSNYLEVLNKIDLLEEKDINNLKAKKSDNQILASAMSSDGVDNLLDIIHKKLHQSQEDINISLDINDGKGLAQIYEQYEVISKNIDINTNKINLNIRKYKK